MRLARGKFKLANQDSTGGKNFTLPAPVVQRLDNAIHWINHCPVDKFQQNKPVHAIRWIVIYSVDSVIHLLNNRGLGPVSRKPRKVFGPVKPFFDHLYVTTEKCIRLKLLVRRDPTFIFRICE